MQSTGIRVRNLDSKVSKIAETVFGTGNSRIPVSHRGHGFLAEIMIQNPSREKSYASQNGSNTNSSQTIQEIENIKE